MYVIKYLIPSAILTMIKLFKHFLRIFENKSESFKPMFLNTGNLNEVDCRNKCSDGKKRELKEGKNPKSTKADWHSSRSGSHMNANWQELRK